ncbi:MAG: hypothetical protein MRY83_03860 [Flavobacteriales bacterium]|nr:hypothetical protein [Flavobacteriales bacterium]
MSLSQAQGLNSISINANEEVLQNELLKITIEDVTSLLSQAFDFPININDPEALVQINLPVPTEKRFTDVEYLNPTDKHFYYPDCNYEWNINQEGIITARLNAKSFEGISAGLYGLLQEQLGFNFYHPRKTIIPRHEEWPIKQLNWSVKERFKKRGFTIHTMHPLELTEPLLNPAYPSGLEIVKEYIDWLARNGQNYFGFRLLKTVKLKAWIAHAREITSYAHQRGVIMGLSLYANQIQQKAFRLYYDPLLRLKSRHQQAMNKIEDLVEANFDVYFIEMSTSEKSYGNLKRKAKLLDDVYLHCAENHILLFAGAVKHNSDGSSEYFYGDPEIAKQYQFRAESSHTFMFYGLTDQKAPIYNYENLLHKTEHLLKWKDQRETWYHPESAYWVTFDNTVPMFLLPYFRARLNDILFCDSLDIPGHHTFSSGWEWGYGLIDWAIARWSWDYGNQNTPADVFYKLLPNQKVAGAVEHLMNIQDKYIKDEQLIRYLCAQTVTDEIPGKNMQFHPQPHWKYKHLFKKASQDELDSLDYYIQRLEKLKVECSVFDKMVGPEEISSVAWPEIEQSILITRQRIVHRIAILKAIHERRMSKIEKRKPDIDTFLGHAEEARDYAQEIVQRREETYAYDLETIARKRKGITAYHFGYLYPVSNLHFWKREEMQIKKNRWGFMHRNIWNVPRIIGLW